MAPLLYFAPIFIYWPQLIGGVETQPFLTVLLCVFAVLFAKDNRLYRSVIFFVILVLALFIVRMLSANGDMQGDQSVLLVLGPVFFLGLVGAAVPPPSRNLQLVMILTLAAMGALEFTLPSAYSSLADSLMHRYSVFDGHRGLAFLTPEPTYGAIAMSYMLLLLLWSNRVQGRKPGALEFLVLCMLVGTLSTYSILLALTLSLALWPWRTGFVLAVAVGSVSAVNMAGVGSSDAVRAVVAITRLFSADLDNLIDSISAVDPSLGSRLVTAMASLQTIIVKPTGAGLSCMSTLDMLQAIGYDFAALRAIGLSFFVTDVGCLKPASYVTAALLAYGAVAIPALYLLYRIGKYSLAGRRLDKPWLPALYVSVLLLVIQCQLTNPIPWYLLFFAFVDPVRAFAKSSRPIPNAEAQFNPSPADVRESMVT